MKKIKFLLLGIVSILGISFSSADCTFHGEVSSYNLSFSQGETFKSYTGQCLRFPSLNLSVFSSLFPSPQQIQTYTFACGNFTIRNSTDSSISSYASYYDNLPYYQDGYIVVSNTGSVEFPKNSSGYLPISENKCMLFINNSVWSTAQICTDSSMSNCAAPSYGRIVCGDSFYYYNTSNYKRTFDFYILDFGLAVSDSGNQSEFTPLVDGGIFDFNTFLIEKSILCYMSSGSFGGSYGNCDGLNYTGFVDQYDHMSAIWSGNSESGYIGNIVFRNAEPVLSNYCVNANSIQYPFCSQLNVYSGAYLMYYYENGILDYLVLGDGFGVDLGNLGSGQLGDLTCYGAWCNNINQGLPEYIFPTNSGNTNNFGLSGDIISEDFYNDYIEKGFWFTCPYSYSGSYFVIGKKLISRLDGMDLMVPINCFISAFSMGSKMLLFGDPQYGNFWSGPLISGNTPGHQRLFLFFDLILSIGIIVVLFKLYNLFTSKK